MRISDAARAKQVKMIELGGERFALWKENLRSKSTQMVWPRVLARFCVAVGKTPAELIDAATLGSLRPGAIAPEIQKLLLTYQSRQRAKGKAGSTVAFDVKVVKSWLAFNGIALPKGFVVIRDADRVYREAALTKDQERAIIHAGNRRERAVFSLLRAGLRPQVIGNYLGTDGLRIRDLADVKIDSRKKTVSWTNLPARVVVRQELSKARHEYSTFLIRENAELVAEYLQERLRPTADWKKGENLTPDAPVICPTADDRHFIQTTNISDAVRSAFRKAGVRDHRPYVTRTTFASRWATLEAEGKAPHRFVVYWLGHTGEMTARYAENRGDLPEELVKEMRASFGRGEYLLSAIPGTSKTDEVQALIKAGILEAAGFQKEDAQAIANDPTKDAFGLARQRIAETTRSAAPAPVRREMAGSEAVQKIVAGARVVVDLREGRYVLEGPASLMDDGPVA